MSHIYNDSHAKAKLATLEDLPTELADFITSYLSTRDLVKLSLVSKICSRFAQSALWRTIELHSRNAHANCFTLPSSSTTKADSYSRAYVDGTKKARDKLPLYRSYDNDFARRIDRFNRVVRDLYKTSKASNEWIRLASYVRHICLTVTSRSPRRIWNMLLSLPNLRTLEIIGEYSSSDSKSSSHHQRSGGGPPKPNPNLPAPTSSEIRNVRLRGYIPVEFVSTLLGATGVANKLTSLDIGLLEPPKLFDRDLEDLEYHGLPTEQPYAAPGGVLWFQATNSPLFPSLTHLHLCRRGPFRIGPDFYGQGYYETREDEAHELRDFAQWALLLRSVRSSVVEVILEQRPVYLDHVLVYNDEWEVSAHDTTENDDDSTVVQPFDSTFYKHALLEVFDYDGLPWPKLRRLTLRGVKFLHAELVGQEGWELFTERILPGVMVRVVPGNYMFFNAQKGFVRNEGGGADGLRPWLGGRRKKGLRSGRRGGRDAFDEVEDEDEDIEDLEMI